MNTNSSTIFAEELANELEKIPVEHWSNLLQIVRLFRESLASASGNKLPDSLMAETIEDLGLVQAMLEVKSETPLSLQEALLELETE
jgi:hypothetical protein